MSFTYPRLVDIHRPIILPNSIGSVGYQQISKSSETRIFTAIQASIQKASSVSDLMKLPGDTESGSLWNIFMRSLQNGDVHDRDIIIDDLDIRYQVTSAYWNSLGYKCLCERLQT